MRDLHIHSNHSDGSYSLEEIIKEAHDKGLDEISITDHDTFSHLYALEELDKGNVKVRPGVEISTHDSRGKTLHLLAYDFHLPAYKLEMLMRKTRKAQHERSLWQLERLLDAGYNLSLKNILKNISKSGVLYKQHLLLALKEGGYCRHFYGDFYKNTFKGDGLCAHPLKTPPAKDVIDAVHEAGGIVVLAHPGETKSFEEVSYLMELGLDGIEVYHPSHGREEEKRALSYGLKAFGGSDSHGSFDDKCKEIGSKGLSTKEDLYEELLTFIKVTSQTIFKENFSIFKKEEEELVTTLDQKMQEAIENFLKDRSDDPILGEESQIKELKDDLWIIDPLDGTRNFILEKEHFAITLAHRVKGELVFGMVYNPTTKELWHAGPDRIVKKNGRPLSYQFQNSQVIEINQKSKGLCMKEIHEDIRAYRYSGSIALSLMKLLEGKRDWFYAEKAYLWDVAGGIYLLQCMDHSVSISEEGYGPFEVEASLKEAPKLHLIT